MLDGDTAVCFNVETGNCHDCSEYPFHRITCYDPGVVVHLHFSWE